MKARDNLEFARHAARLRWGRATAFRIGVEVGERGLRTSNPYAFKSRGFDNFEEGLRFGISERPRAKRGDNA